MCAEILFVSNDVLVQRSDFQLDDGQVGASLQMEHTNAALEVKIGQAEEENRSLQVRLVPI